MFEANSTEDVLLGVPSTREGVTTTCYTSKIGGYPLWLLKDVNNEEVVDIKCSTCGGDMLFVMQIYAPIGDMERVLYVYCCPSSCASQSCGWKIVKQQISPSLSNQKQDDAADNTSESLSLENVKIDVCSSNISKSSAAEKTSWNLDDDDDDDSDDDFASLSALIDARDESLNQVENVANKKSKAPKSFGLPQPHHAPTQKDFSNFNQSDHDDGIKDLPVSRSLHAGFIIENEMALAEIYESDCVVTTKCPGSHVDTLLQKYIDESISHGEEDPNVISLLQEEQSKMCAKKKKVGNDESDDEYEDQDDVEFNNSIRHIQGFRKSMAIERNKQSTERRLEGDDAHKKGNHVDNKNDWNKRRKVEAIFHTKISLAPSQVLRYAYGGHPLWCSLPSPPINKIPRCDACNSGRVFECQIMPHLISFVNTEMQRRPTNNDARKGGTLDETELTGGFDFGVVSIWCCPNSCDNCAYEVAVVQPPADIA